MTMNPMTSFSYSNPQERMTKINDNTFIDFRKAYCVQRIDEIVKVFLAISIPIYSQRQLIEETYSGEFGKQVWAAFLKWQEGQA